MATASTQLHPDLTMAEVLERFPGARRALFQRYHIGGCSSCGFDDSDTLRTVLTNHSVDDVDAAMAAILQFADLDRRMQISAAELAEQLRGATPPRLIDVRSPHEFAIARIAGGELLTEELFDELRALEPNTALVFYCHHGIRSLDAAAYFAGHGFANVRSLSGGIDAWSVQIDADVARY